MDGIRESYERIAEAYAVAITPVDRKPFDCVQLDRFLDGLPDGPIWDVGCGPGDVTRYLSRTRPDVTGIDLSDGMIRTARRIDPEGRYLVGDMTRLALPGEALAGMVAFYAIIHLAPCELAHTLEGWREAVRPGGRLLVAVHEGTGTLHLDTMLDEPVHLDFHFFSVDQLTELLTRAGFVVSDIAVREPYPAMEAQTRRIYVQAVRPADAT